jgi:hypothetical protein
MTMAGIPVSGGRPREMCWLHILPGRRDVIPDNSFYISFTSALQHSPARVVWVV